MQFRLFPIAAFFTLLLVPQGISLAVSGDLGLIASSIRFQPGVSLEGRPTRIYITVHNFGNQDLKGNVRFSNGKPASGNQIQGDQAVSVVANGDDIVFVDALLSPGEHEVFILLLPFESNGDNPSNNIVSKKITVLKDTDRDGVTDSKDPDDDNDGVMDSEDLFPLNSKESKDTDGDTKGDNSDDDDDNDGVPDREDDLPLNAGESKDTDEDGIGDKQDEDDDGDEIPDEQEIKLGLDPVNSDTDGDTVFDSKDAFPFDPKESGDYDNDGTGDHADEDADNDGILKNEDTNDLNLPPKISLTSLPFFLIPGREFFLNLSKSMDPDGVIKTAIIKGDGMEQNVDFQKPVALHFDKPGAYTLTLIAVDDKNERTEKQLHVSVRTPVFYTLLALIIFVSLVLAVLITMHFMKKTEGKPRARKGRLK